MDYVLVTLVDLSMTEATELELSKFKYSVAHLEIGDEVVLIFMSLLQHQSKKCRYHFRHQTRACKFSYHVCAGYYNFITCLDHLSSCAICLQTRPQAFNVYSLYYFTFLHFLWLIKTRLKTKVKKFEFIPILLCYEVDVLFVKKCTALPFLV